MRINMTVTTKIHTTLNTKSNVSKTILLIGLSLFTGLFSHNLSAKNNADALSGDEIAIRVNQRDEGVAVSRDLRMEMVDRKGKKRIRDTRTFRKYYGDDKRTVIFYKSPKNVKDTAFLTLDYADKAQDDDQWLYLPAMRKVRRISASDRGDYFLGTDFTYEDIKLESRVSLKDYQREKIGKDTIDGFECVVVKATTIDQSVAKELGHAKREDCFDKTIWISRRSILWDDKNQLLKTIHFKDIEQVQGIWTIKTMIVENHKTQHKTIFTFSNIDYQQPIQDNIFTTHAIKRGL